MGSLLYCNICFGLPSKIVIHLRHLSTSPVQVATNSALSYQGKVFNKILNRSSKKKRKFIFENTQLPSSSGDKLSFGQSIKNNKENSRRIAVLNSLFMKHISDLLVTETIGVDLLNKGLEISRVSMNSDFNQVNVFWGTYSEENVAELESILPDIGYTLRHELSQLKIVGVVPRIVFVKDKHFSNGAKVEYLLRIADFGEDHVPSQMESEFKAVPSSTQVNDKNQSLNTEDGESEPSTLEDEEVMPAMRHDVFNLDHQLIMNKIMKKLYKSRAFHRFEPNLAIKSDGHSVSSSEISPTDNITNEDRKKALAKFILSRKILQEKRNQYKHKSEREIHLVQEDNENDHEEFEEVDYIEEDFEEKNFQN